MKRQLAIAVLGAALLPLAATNVRADGAGSVVSGPESIRNSGGLGVQLLLTADEKKFRDVWSQPGPPNLTVTNTVRKGGQVSALLLFGGCAANAGGVCDLVSDFMVEGPDGKKTPGGSGAVWQGKPMAPGRVQLGTITIRMQFDDTDPPGDYRISADVKDRVSGNAVSVSTVLKLAQ